MAQTRNPFILPVPHFHQSSDGECLATCVAMVLAYKSLNFSYKRLLQLLSVTEYGTPFSNLLRLESLKVTVIVQQRGSLQLLEELLHQNYPCIASVDTGDLPYWSTRLPHAVVVVGIDDTYIYLNDPGFSQAPMRVTKGDFDLAWLNRNDEEYAIIK